MGGPTHALTTITNAVPKKLKKMKTSKHGVGEPTKPTDYTDITLPNKPTNVADPKVEGRQTASCLSTGKGCCACGDSGSGGPCNGGDDNVLKWHIFLK
jgi:hypothetical protein